MKFFLITLVLLGFLSGCKSAKDAFTLQKKPTTDEFLVEKKNPLTVPPDYRELPIPISEQEKKLLMMISKCHLEQVKKQQVKLQEALSLLQ